MVLLFFRCSREETNQTIITMRTDANEIDIHSLLANDIDRLRETGKTIQLELHLLDRCFSKKL